MLYYVTSPLDLLFLHCFLSFPTTHTLSLFFFIRCLLCFITFFCYFNFSFLSSLDFSCFVCYIDSTVSGQNPKQNKDICFRKCCLQIKRDKVKHSVLNCSESLSKQILLHSVFFSDYKLNFTKFLRCVILIKFIRNSSVGMMKQSS